MLLHHSTAPGDTVVVIGGGDYLAGWNKDNAVRMTTSKNEFPWWSTEIAMPAGERCEFKFAIKRANGGFDWEAGDNRIYEVPPKPGKCHVAASSMFGMRMMIDSGIPLPGVASASTIVERRESKMEVIPQVVCAHCFGGSLSSVIAEYDTVNAPWAFPMPWHTN